MANLELLVRANQTPAVSPPRRAGGVTCSNEGVASVILQLGKSAAGRVFSTSYKLDTTGYMTKKQKELAEEDE
jgi:hypothetical protein